MALANRRVHGFTLVELLVVIAIIALLICQQRSGLDGHSNFEGCVFDTQLWTSLSRALQGPDQRTESVIRIRSAA